MENNIIETITSWNASTWCFKTAVKTSFSGRKWEKAQKLFPCLTIIDFILIAIQTNTKTKNGRQAITTIKCLTVRVNGIYCIEIFNTKSVAKTFTLTCYHNSILVITRFVY